MRLKSLEFIQRKTHKPRSIKCKWLKITVKKIKDPDRRTRPPLGHTRVDISHMERKTVLGFLHVTLSFRLHIILNDSLTKYVIYMSKTIMNKERFCYRI